MGSLSTPTVPEGGGFIPGQGVSSDTDLMAQLRKAVDSNEELARAVTDIQMSVTNLEIQVSDLQLQMQHYEFNQEQTGPQQFGIHTPRVEGQQQALEGWWSEQPPAGVNDLAAQQATLRSGPGLSVTPQVAGSTLAGDLTGLPPVESSAQPRTDVLSGWPGANTGEGGLALTQVVGGEQLVSLPTDSDVFSFLAGAQPNVSSAQRSPQGPTRDHDQGRYQPVVPQLPFGCERPSLPTGEEKVLSPPGLGVADASPQPPTQAELGMILKAIQTFLSDLPKLELGDMASRATRLLSWKSAMEQALVPVGAHLRDWWKWCLHKAGVAHKQFLAAPIHTRESIMPLDTLPSAWVQIDSWMRPRLLEAVPSVIREWVSMRGRNGKVDETHLIIFWVVKQFGPGSAEEQVAINNNILNPHVCSQPRAAQVELMKWKENIRRLAELGSTPPALLLTYRAMESIFNVVFDKAEPLLNARWIALKNQLGLPYRIISIRLRLRKSQHSQMRNWERWCCLAIPV